MKNNQHNTTLLVAFISMLFLTSCNTLSSYGVFDKNNCGSQRMLGKWFDYYSRGLCQYRASQYDLALLDFSTAREFRSADKRRARTYGMHYIDYFPQREIGIVYFHQGKFERSIQSLEQSLQHASSSRTLHYLYKAREIVGEGSNSNHTPTTITTSFIGDSIFTSENTFSFTVFVQAGLFLNTLTINGEQIELDSNTKILEKKVNIHLDAGVNILEIAVVDAAGVKTIKESTIHFDIVRPLFLLDKAYRDNNYSVVQGRAFDEAGIEYLEINGEKVALTESNRLQMINGVEVAEVTFDHKFMSNDVLHVKIMDGAGNYREDTLYLENNDLNESTLGLSISRMHPIQIAAGHSWRNIFSISNMWGNMLNDSQPPVITLDNYKRRQTVYNDTVVLSGSITDLSGTEAFIKLNKKNVQSIYKKEMLKEGTLAIYFDVLIELDRIINEVVIEAVDDIGNESPPYKTTLVYDKPKYSENSERMKLKWDNFNSNSKLLDESTLGLKVRKALRSDRRFYLQSNTKPDLRVDISAEDFGNGEIEVQAIPRDSEGGDLVDYVVDVYDDNYEDRTQEELKEYFRSLAVKLANKFPIIKGGISEFKNGNEMEIDVGTKDGMTKQHRLIIYCKEVREGDCGKIANLKPNLTLGYATILSVQENSSTAKLANGLVPKNVPIHNIKFVTR